MTCLQVGYAVEADGDSKNDNDGDDDAIYYIV